MVVYLVASPPDLLLRLLIALADTVGEIMKDPDLKPIGFEKRLLKED